jgi:hypothetical protein
MKSIAPPRRKPMATRVAPVALPPMDNVMIDLETLGRRAGCAIRSIGAVAFDPETGKLGKELYVVVDRQSQPNLHTDPETLKWWEGQSVEARAVLTDTSAISLGDALIKFNQYLSQFNFTKVKIWGNGADFDNAIMASCYAAAGLEVPWSFWNNRCYRTLKGVIGGPKIKREGTYHNALDDAKTQALHALELFKILRE